MNKYKFTESNRECMYLECTNRDNRFTDIDCSKTCSSFLSDCLFIVTLLEYKSITSNPPKWASTHLQPSNNTNSSIAKLLLNDQILL